jgi:hypothetical protein
MRTTIITALILAVLGSAAAAAATTPLFVGTTAKRLPIYVRLTAGGDRVKELRVTWTDNCAKRQKKFTRLTLGDDIHISGGSFSVTRRYREAGTGRRVTFFVTGTLGSVARGRFAVRAKKGGRTCRTGMVSWTAARVS